MGNATITERLADLQSWRYGLASQIKQVGAFLRLHGFLTANTESALSEILDRVNRQRITVALVAEAARGKSELINALFFAEQGHGLLPTGPVSGTRCVTEIRFERNVQTSVKLLPIETRESPKRIADLVADETRWRSILFDADNVDSTAGALAALSETKRISLAEAVAWGLHAQGVAVSAGEGTALVDVPRWRYAIINFPHPLLDAGLVIIDTPGLAALVLEPELARDRVPNADALVFVLDITSDISKSELALWKDHLAGAQRFRGREGETIKQPRLIALNRIDELAEPAGLQPEEASREHLREIDRRVRLTAELLRIDPIFVVPVSARLGLAGKLAHDPDRKIRSRLYQLERAIAANLPRDRNDPLTREVVATLSGALALAQAQLDNDRFETLSALRQLGALREKNEKLTATIVAQTSSKHDRLEAALRELKSIKNVHGKLAEELAAIVDLAAAGKDAARARAAILGSRLPGTTAEVVQQYFSVTGERLDAVETKIQEIRDLFGNIGERMRRDFDLDLLEVHPFATQRFQTELQKVQAKAETEFTRTSNLLVRRGTTLAAQFDELISSRVLHVFEIASRETTTWMRGLFTSVEMPMEQVRLQTLQRSEKVEKIKSAELDLAERIADMQARIDVIKRKHTALAESQASLDRFTGIKMVSPAA